MLVVEGAEKRNGKCVLPIDKEIEAIISRVLRARPIIEIEIVRKGNRPFLRKKAPEHILRSKSLLKYAKKRDTLLARAKAVANRLLDAERNNRSEVNLKLEIDLLRQELKRLYDLIKKYERLCHKDVVFVKDEYIGKVSPIREDLGAIVDSDFLQLLITFLTSK